MAPILWFACSLTLPRQHTQDEIFTGHVEILHMLETVSLTEDILVRHPEVREKTIAGAREMAESLDKVWDNLNDLVLNPKPFMS